MGYIRVTAEDFAQLEGLSDWRYAGEAISAEFSAGSFTAAAALIVEMAGAAEAADHHPDIDLRYPDLVLVGLSTHAMSGVTMHDVELARKISKLSSGDSNELPPPP